MVIGCVWCPKEKTHQIHKRMRDIKRDNGISPAGEIKWVKVSKGNIKVYNQLVNYFFYDDINFRCIVIDKRIITNVQCLPSHEVGLLQMCDVLIGAIGYNQSGLTSNAGKIEAVNLIKKRSGRSLSMQTLPSGKKFNLFFWHGDRA